MVLQPLPPKRRTKSRISYREHTELVDDSVSLEDIWAEKMPAVREVLKLDLLLPLPPCCLNKKHVWHASWASIKATCCLFWKQKLHILQVDEIKGSKFIKFMVTDIMWAVRKSMKNNNIPILQIFFICTEATSSLAPIIWHWMLFWLKHTPRNKKNSTIGI